MSEEREVVEPAAPTAEAPKKFAPPIELKDGSLNPSNHLELRATLSQIAAGNGFPARFDTPEKRMAAYNLAHSLMGARWQLCLNNIAEIKGQLSIYGELPGALAEQTKEVEEKEVYCIDAKFQKICIENKNLDEFPYAGVCFIQRKGRSKKEFTYTLEDAKHAGQYPPMKAEWVNKQKTGNSIVNEDSPWHKWPKTMLMRKAMALGINFEFADAKVGVPVAEYDFDEAPDLKDVTPKVNRNDRVTDLNARFKSSEPVEQAQ